ncbi:CRP-like cAMP-binding protein [Novosphingobium sp. SG751A]|uniref:Crp/Fnr family transcriptional regulator n=1 Tax=Novosphingobium sp. SG751A TaxID=2587000 RepID=UPI0015574719|nr:Crp/Fnr family transcriptional regulator [Novosphingobium sp. SG751A]NOW46378.1 CRP-like cAMP-binding protein [Novosphingobium sp. SG751A]
MTAARLETTATRNEIRRHKHLARRHENTDRIFRVEEGWACQYRLLPDGRRQIIALFLPGDYCEAQWVLTGHANWPVVALTDMFVTEIPFRDIRAHGGGEFDGMKSMLGSIMHTLKSHEKWIVNLGRMSATERICALLHDLVERLRPTGKVVSDHCPMPLTQYDLADIVGISSVHVNRVLQMLRSEGVISLEAGRLALLNPAELRRLGGPAHA